jgi:plasmid replication initiation protein
MSTSKIDGKYVLLKEENSGRDEMNLAGNPFALLQASSRSGQTYILNEWDTTLNGKVVRATWNVNGHALLGLPGPTEELLYLVLLQLTRENAGEGSTSADWKQKIPFSRYDVLNRMGMGATTRHYEELKKAFIRLQSVSIQADNSFYNPVTGQPHKSIGFSILNDYALNDEPKGRKSKTQNLNPLSWFEWNRVIYDSFIAGNVRSLALDFALSLEFPTSRRLFRFLDMMRGQTAPPRREFTIGIMKLRDKLGMNPYRYPSKIKQVLAPAIEELKSRGYLESVRYEKGKADENAIFRFASISPLSESIKTPDAPRTPPEREKQAVLFETEQPVNDIRTDAVKCHAIFVSLPESEQAELLTLARQAVSPIWHDRVGQPSSPMSLGLWQLVAERHSEKLK